MFCIRQTGLEHLQQIFFFNNPHFLGKMQSSFLEVVHEPRPSPLLSIEKLQSSPRASSLSGLSEVSLQSGTTSENRLKDIKVKGSYWDPARREEAPAVFWEKPRPGFKPR